jgi:hypothetical protein
MEEEGGRGGKREGMKEEGGERRDRREEGGRGRREEKRGREEGGERRREEGGLTSFQLSLPKQWDTSSKFLLWRQSGTPVG